MAGRTIFKPRATVGYNGSVQYPFGEGTSKSPPPLPLPKRMAMETSPRREDIPVGMKRGKFVETSAFTSFATTTTKAVEMESQRLAPCVTINLDDIDDGPIVDRDINVKRLKLGDSSNTILETSSAQAAPNKRGDNESMPIVIDGSDGEADCPSANAWSMRWLFNGGKVVKKPEGVCPPDDEEPGRPSVAAMALMGRAILNDYQKPCEVQKRGGVMVWKT